MITAIHNFDTCPYYNFATLTTVVRRLSDFWRGLDAGLSLPNESCSMQSAADRHEVAKELLRRLRFLVVWKLKINYSTSDKADL